MWISKNPNVEVQCSGIIWIQDKNMHQTYKMRIRLWNTFVEPRTVEPPTQNVTVRCLKHVFEMRSRVYLQQQLSRANNMILKWQKASNGCNVILAQQSSEDATAEAWDKEKRALMITRMELEAVTRKNCSEKGIQKFKRSMLNVSFNAWDKDYGVLL